MRIYSF